MTRKEDLPDSPEGFIVFPRRIALAAAITSVLALVAPAASIWNSDQNQERRIIEIERRMMKAEERSEKDRGDIADMKADIRVIRQILEAPARRP
jgi:hypothetical protein